MSFGRSRYCTPFLIGILILRSGRGWWAGRSHPGRGQGYACPDIERDGSAFYAAGTNNRNASRARPGDERRKLKPTK